MQGGIADYTAYLAQHLASHGIEPSILISRRWQETLSVNPPTTSAPPPPTIHPSIPNWGWRCWPGVVSFLKTHQPAVLHIQYQAAAFDLGGWVNWLPWYLKKWRLSTRVVTTFHDLRPPYIFPKAGSFRWRSMLALARYSDGVVCTNREDLQILQHALKVGQTGSLTHNSAPLLTHIPLGSNVEPQPPPNFDRAAWRKQYQADNDAFLMAYFGFLNESKGGEELVEALGLLRQQGLDARLLLIGGEVGHADPTNVAYAQRVQALIERHKLAEVVYRTGYVGLVEVSANLLAADAVVMPYRDGVSFRRTTLVAALRHGCPVVSTLPADPAALPEIEPGNNMLLARPQDVASVAQAIKTLVEDTALREKLARGAKQLGDLFEWAKIAQAQAVLYQSLVS